MPLGEFIPPVPAPMPVSPAPGICAPPMVEPVVFVPPEPVAIDPVVPP
jgi:hypothetical protein